MTAAPGWAEKYVGIPYANRGSCITGCDCWGLVRMVYRQELGISLSPLGYRDAEDAEDVERAVIGEVPEWTLVDQPREYDVVLMRVAGHPVHCGIALSDVWMLHTMRGHGAALERYMGAKWRSRIHGVYRHG